MDRTGGWGCTKSNYHKERGRETQRIERQRERGKEINLLIFHGQPVVITMCGALRTIKSRPI